MEGLLEPVSLKYLRERFVVSEHWVQESWQGLVTCQVGLGKQPALVLVHSDTPPSSLSTCSLAGYGQ